MANGKISNSVDPTSGGKMFTGTQGVHIHESMTRVPNAQNNPGENLSNSASADEYSKAAKDPGSFAISK